MARTKKSIFTDCAPNYQVRHPEPDAAVGAEFQRDLDLK
jgi:hypothetical protein